MHNVNAALRLQDISETLNPGGVTLLGFRRLWRGARPAPGPAATAPTAPALRSVGAPKTRKETTC